MCKELGELLFILWFFCKGFIVTDSFFFPSIFIIAAGLSFKTAAKLCFLGRRMWSHRPGLSPLTIMGQSGLEGQRSGWSGCRAGGGERTEAPGIVLRSAHRPLACSQATCSLFLGLTCFSSREPSPSHSTVGCILASPGDTQMGASPTGGGCCRMLLPCKRPATCRMRSGCLQGVSHGDLSLAATTPTLRPLLRRRTKRREMSSDSV